MKANESIANYDIKVREYTNYAIKSIKNVCKNFGPRPVGSEAEQKAQAEAMSAALREEGEAFLKANAEKEGVVVLPSGLQYKVITEGTGKKPSATSQVKCHYEGTFLNGAKFDSSYDRNAPATFGLNQVIKGWTEGVQLMSEGSKYEFYIPYDLAYGEHGAPGAIPPYATLKFVVELIEVL